MTTGGIECNTSQVTAGCRKLMTGLPAAVNKTGLAQANVTANQIRARVPVLTGRLRATVHAIPIPDGGAVTYGGSLPYARKIERRTHAVENARTAGTAEFQAAMTAAAAREVNSL